MKERIMLLLLAILFSIGQAAAQSRTVSGQVISSEDNQPVIGASVLVKGTTIGAVSDQDGKFTIKNVPNNAKHCIVSYIGMVTKEVNIQPVMHIVLSPQSQTVDEVVVVAFGTAKKSAFTGTASFVKSEELSKHITTNVVDALSGSVPGLQLRSGSGAPGSNDSKISIRGISSLYAGTEPLIIVDGSPYPGNLSNIPQNDIASISVLKDAASAALYGARGAAGVIIITTKKGTVKKTTVTLDVKLGVNSRAIQDYDVITDPKEYYNAYFTQVYNLFSSNPKNTPENAYSKAYARFEQDLGGYNIYDLPAGEKLFDEKGVFNSKAKLGRKFKGSNGEYYLTKDDWTKESYRTALRQDYNLSISGGTSNNTYYASMGYLTEDGIIDFSSYDRFYARLKNDYKLKKWLKMSTNINYVHSNQESNPGIGADLVQTNLFYYTSMIAPIFPVFVRTVDKDGSIQIARNNKGDIIYDYGIANLNGGLNRPFLAPGNPIGANRYNEYKTITDQLNANISFDVLFTDYLKFTASNTLIWTGREVSDYGSSLVLPKSSVGGEITKGTVNHMRSNFIQTLTFFKQFGKHDINALIGHEYYRSQYKYLDATASGNFSPEIKEINAFANKKNSRSYQTEYDIEGYFASLQYNWDSKYFASLSFRRDASSRFAKEHHWGNFWSIGGAWLLSKENFMNNVNWINTLKLKLSVGQQGNDNIKNWAFIDMYSLSKASDKAMSPSFYQIGNPNITWETTTNTNLGLEFSIFKNRLSGSIDLYNKLTDNLLFWLSIPESMGSRGYYGNIGKIRNRGVELVLSGQVIKTKYFDWNLNFNISHNSTKIISLPKSKILNNGGFLEKAYWYKVGGPLYNYMTYSYAGVDKKTGKALYWYDKNLSPEGGKVKGNIVNKPGQERSGTTDNIDKATRYEFGSNLPDAFGGFGTSFRFGHLDLSLNFDYQLGGKIYDLRYQELMSPTVGKPNGYNFHKDWKLSWSAQNMNSNIPRWQYNDKFTSYASDRFLTSASYLNFQSFTIGYTFPEKMIKGISGLRLYLAGENLYFWSKRKGLDPRYDYGRSESLSTYSPSRNITGGLQLSF